MIPIEERLRALVRVACEDALFAIAGAGLKALDDLAERRRRAHEAIAREGLGSAVVMADLDEWLATMVRATAPSFAPWFVPMREAIDDGMTLLREPRGLRAVIPIGLEQARARLRREAICAVRVARAVAAADAVVSPDEERSIDLLVAALGLPDDDVRMLRNEPAVPISAIEVPELDPKTARAILAGAWQVAAADRIEDREHEALEAIATRLSVDAASVVEIGRATSEAIEQQRRIGRALVDVVRYVLLPVPPEDSSALALAVIQLTVPRMDRDEASRLVRINTSTPLVDTHPLDRGARERVLAAAWCCALALDPPLSLRAHLRARHTRAAMHLDAERVGADARRSIEEWLEETLARGTAIVGV